MKKFFGFGKGKKRGLSPSPSDTSSVLSAGYQLQDKDLDKLHRAAYSGDVSKIKQLLRKQDVNQQDNASRTPLHLACANGQTDVVSMLVENHAKVNLCDSENRSPLMKAIQCQQESCAAVLLGHNADPNVVDVNGNAALHFAARIPSITIASQLLEHGADIDAPNKDGCTPLMLATIENNEEMVEFLLREGANINSKDVNERTSLMVAASNGHIGLVKMLLEHDADISTQDEKGWSADDHAVMHGHHACSHLIIEHSSRKKSSDPFRSTAKRRGTSGLSNPNKDVDGVFTLGSPATDKAELRVTPKQTSAARDAGKVTDDFSQAESESRASQKSAATDSWPSSDDDFDLSPQKAPKPNLKKLFHTKATVDQKSSFSGAQSVALSPQNRFSSEDESSRGSDDNDPPQPRPFPKAYSFPEPVQLTPGSFTKLSQMPSSLFALKKNDPSDDEADGKEGSDFEDHPEENAIKAALPRTPVEERLPGPADPAVGRKETLMSELGLDEDDVESPWDSEASVASPRKQSSMKLTQSSNEEIFKKKSPVEKEEPRAVGSLLPMKEASPTSPSAHSSTNVKSDVMADLGLDDADDIEDVSELDSTSFSLKVPAIAASIGKFTEEPLEAKARTTAPGPLNNANKASSLPPMSKRSDSEEEENGHAALNQNLLTPSKKDLQQTESSDEFSEESSAAAVEERKTADSLSPTKEVFSSVSSARTSEGYTKSDLELVDADDKEDSVMKGALTQANSKSLRPLESQMVQNLGNNLVSSSDSEEPWEERYEKMWVDNEKKEVKTHFKEVTAELKHKFGEITETKKKENIMSCDNLTNSKNTAHGGDLEDTPDSLLPQDNVDQGLDIAVFEETQMGPTPPNDQNTSSVPIVQVDANLHGCTSVSLGVDTQTTSDTNDDDKNPHETDKTDGRMDNVLVRSKDGEVKHDFSSLPIKNYLRNSFSLINDGPGEKRTPLKSENVGSGTVQPTETGSFAVNFNGSVQKHSDLRPPEQNEHDISRAPLQSPIVSPPSDLNKQVLDKQLKQDMQRFKNEVGMLQSVFLDLVKGNGQLQDEVHQKGKGENERLQLISDSDNSHGDGKAVQRRPTLSDLQNKPKQMARDRLSKGKDSSEGSKNTRLIKKSGLRKPRIQHRATTNGNPMDAFDDSSLSETSQEDAGRNGNQYLSGNKIDADEFSQSSDTASDAIDSPTFRNAMLIMEELTADCPSSLNLIKIEDIIRQYERSLQKETGRYALLADKVKSMETDHKDLQQLAERNRELTSRLEHQKVEWESDLNHLRFMLKQEEEKRKSAEMLYDKGRDQLRKKEDQCCKEMEEKQQLEMALRNMEREVRSLSNNVKKAEEERHEAQRLLSQERNARALQEDFLNNLRRKNEEEEAARIIMTKTAEAHSQPAESSEREKDLLQRNRTLQDEITLSRQELEKVQRLNEEEKRQYAEDIDMLKERVDDLKRDLKVNEESLTQNLIQYNGQLNALRTEATIFCTKLEHEKQAKERLETELESLRSRLTSVLQELEKSQTSKTDTERSLQRERDEWMRSKDKLSYDLANSQENNKNLSQQLGKAEAKCNDLECELHRKGLSLQERVVLVESMQRELTQAQCRIKELESTLTLEKDQFNKSTIKQESAQERLAQVQNENLQLRQQLDDLQSKGVIKDKAVSDVQDRFTDIFGKLRSDTERQVFLVEERNKDLINKSNELREQIYRLETDKVEGESARRQLQQELADAFKKLSMSEASLEVITRYRNDLEEEKQNFHKELEKCKNKLQDLEEQYIQSERLNHQLKNLLDDKEREIAAAVQKAQEFAAAKAAAEKSAKQLEEHVQKLEIENAKIEATAKHQTNQIEILQRELQESIANRKRMEDLVTSLQSSKMGLEDKLNQQVYKQTAVSLTAQESHNMWEDELKSRSRLGIRLAELDREKAELAEQVDRERKKVKKLAEMKRSMDSRFDEEVKRSGDLHRELSGMKRLLKTAKKKLKEYESSGNQQSKSDGTTAHKNLDDEPEFCRLKDKMEQLSITLERESMRHKQLESRNRELQDELYSMALSHKKQERHEKGRRHLEDEVTDLKRHLDSSKMDQSTMESFKREIEEKGRQEVRQKLEDVNLFLQTQAAAQDSLEQIRAATDASLRSQLESRIQDLETELHKIKSAQKESECQKESSQTELDRFKELYAEEMKMRKSLAGKLERTYERLEEANTKLLNERQRSKSLIASSIMSGNLGPSPVLDVSPLGLHSRSLTLNGGFGPGGSFLSSTGNGLPTNRMDSYLAQVQLDLEKSIARELQQANTGPETGYTRVPPVGSTAATVRIPDADLDPLSRTTQQYLEVLKKNNML